MLHVHVYSTSAETGWFLCHWQSELGCVCVRTRGAWQLWPSPSLLQIVPPPSPAWLCGCCKFSETRQSWMVVLRAELASAAHCRRCEMRKCWLCIFSMTLLIDVASASAVLITPDRGGERKAHRRRNQWGLGAQAPPQSSWGVSHFINNNKNIYEY